MTESSVRGASLANHVRARRAALSTLIIIGSVGGMMVAGDTVRVRLDDALTLDI